MQEFLATHEIEVKETVNATKERMGADEALKLAKAASRVVAGRGKKVVSFDMKNDPPDDETLLKHLLGPSGNLRAPTSRRGKTLLVGFHEDEFTSILT
jgi:arsenate reductase-like glutaredoxin family protein